VRDIAYHRHPDTPDVTSERITRHHYNARGLLTQSADPRLYDAGLANFTYLTNLLSEIVSMTRPMRVIAGELDPVTTIADAEFLVANAPHAELQCLPASHISNIACPDLFNHSVVGFLTDVCALE
jgi:pimeloyl-ACP methyl ester carboxylesterase